MTTVNNRLKKPQALVINGVDAGGTMTARILMGFDSRIASAPDGLEVPLSDRDTQFVRGTVVTQDWVHAIELLTGVVGTYVFYERKSGTAVETGFVKHTITNPVIHRISIGCAQGRYITVSFDFECRAADPTKTIGDMWTALDSQAAPTYVPAARGGYRVQSCTHGTGGTQVVVNHVTDFEFNITMPLTKACNDSDIGYTCCEAELSGLAAGGSVGFQDAAITASVLVCQQLAAAAKGALVLTVTQSQGAAAKAITIAGVEFDNAGSNSDAAAPFTGYTGSFTVVNDATTQLTLAGANKIVAIA